MGKLPAIQWYPGDWQNDMGVQSLSFHDRGVWIELLFIMHQSDERGKLSVNGKPIPLKTLGKRLGLHGNSLRKTLGKLREKNVISYDKQSGIYYSRRMVKDEDILQKRRRSGSMGGNPNFEKGKGNPYYQKDKQKDKQKDNQKITPSSSSSSSSSTTDNTAGAVKDPEEKMTWDQKNIAGLTKTLAGVGDEK